VGGLRGRRLVSALLLQLRALIYAALVTSRLQEAPHHSRRPGFQDRSIRAPSGHPTRIHSRAFLLAIQPTHGSFTCLHPRDLPRVASNAGPFQMLDRRRRGRLGAAREWALQRSHLPWNQPSAAGADEAEPTARARRALSGGHTVGTHSPSGLSHAGRAKVGSKRLFTVLHQRNPIGGMDLALNTSDVQANLTSGWAEIKEHHENNMTILVRPEPHSLRPSSPPRLCAAPTGLEWVFPLPSL